jgi:hypothetical protein
MDNLPMRGSMDVAEDEFVADVANIVLEQRLKFLRLLQFTFGLLLVVLVKTVIWPFTKYWWNLLKLKCK